MNRFRVSAAVFSGVLVMILGISGCVVERPERDQAVYVQVPPPAPLAEIQPPPPGTADLWVWKQGYYRWDRGRYIWEAGQWEQRPRHGAVWIPPHWERSLVGWIFVEGHFRE